VSRDFFHDQPLPTLWEPARAADQRVDCFADEIAIDFPSVDPLVARARETFFGGPTDVEVLTAEVQLTSRAASLGTIVPLEVPLRNTCALCGGRGETWTEPCADCSGTGESLVHHPIRLPVPPGIADGARVRFRVSSPHAAPMRFEIRVAIANR
jgi:hypothetical protein